jgi:NADPH:quinone reductase-like Zn-dependent oxidoreductase
VFAEYILLKGDIAMHIPPNISFEEAATLPCGLATVVVVYKALSLPLPTFPINQEEKKDGRVILIYGGSTATGALAIQFAKLLVPRPLYFPILFTL